MGVVIKDNKSAIIIEPKIIYFDLSKEIGNDLKHETDIMIEHLEIFS